MNNFENFLQVVSALPLNDFAKREIHSLFLRKEWYPCNYSARFKILPESSDGIDIEGLRLYFPDWHICITTLCGQRLLSFCKTKAVSQPVPSKKITSFSGCNSSGRTISPHLFE